jgi:hypothetical protein
VTADPRNLKKPIPWPDPVANPGDEPIFWFIAWLSVAFAGGLFGMIIGFMDWGAGTAIIGFIAGIIIAGIYAIPIVATFGLLTWTLWLSQFGVITAAMAGACTGILTTATLGPPSDIELMLIPGCIGGIVTGCVTGYYWRKLRQWGYGSEAAAGSTWQFSLRDLFLRFTIATAILAAWMFALTSYFQN